jgi:hypothetical protein
MDKEENKLEELNISPNEAELQAEEATKSAPESSEQGGADLGETVEESEKEHSHEHHHHHHHHRHANPYVAMHAELYDDKGNPTVPSRRSNPRGGSYGNPHRPPQHRNQRGNVNNPRGNYNSPKGNLNVNLESSTAFSQMANTEEVDISNRHKAMLRMGIIMGILTVLATVLRLLAFSPSFLPAFLTLDFSALPEVIASIAYGPVFGVLIVFIKNIIYVGIKIKALSIPALITNLVLNSIFVFITGAFYSRKMFPFDPNFQQPKRDLRWLHILGGGAIASAIVAVVSFFLAKYVTYPITFKHYAGYNEEYIVYLYQVALNNLNEMLPAKLQGIVTEIGSLSKGIAIYNIPHTFFKYFIITLIATLIYNFLSPLLHYRNAAPEEREEYDYVLQQNNENIQ